MDFPNNSDKAKETQGRPEVKAVTNGELKRTTKELVKSQFYADDAGKIGQHLLIDVIIPMVKKVIVDVVNGTLNMIFYNSGTAGGSTNVPASRISIGGRNSSNEYHSASRNTVKEASDRAYDLNYVIVESQQAAKDVLQQMSFIVDQYGSVRANELCALANITAPYTYVDYGWDSVANAQTIPLLDGRVKIQMPQAKYMK